MIPVFLLILSHLNLPTYAETKSPNYLCSLSITTASGINSTCNAVHIGNGRLLTASHCFPNGKSILKSGIIIAKCGEEEFTEFKSIKQTTLNSSNSEDLALLELTINANNKLHSTWIRPTRYPAMYFDGNQLKNTAECEIQTVSKRIHISLIRNTRLTLKLNEKIFSLPRYSSSIENNFSVKHGDSGGALVCKYQKNAPYELIAIIESFATHPSTKEISYNLFSPVFSDQAQEILK